MIWAQLIVACTLISAMVGAGAAMLKAGRWLWDTSRKLARLADDLTGEPARPGLPEGRKSLLDRMASIESRLDMLPTLEARLVAVEAQLHTNGGSTLRDAVDRLAPAEAQA